MCAADGPRKAYPLRVPSSRDMASRSLPLIQIGLGLVSAIALILYGILVAADLIFWLFAAVFLVFIGVDAALHVRSLRGGEGGRSGGSR